MERQNSVTSSASGASSISAAQSVHEGQVLLASCVHWWRCIGIGIE
jgi:hypothetical protein